MASGINGFVPESSILAIVMICCLIVGSGCHKKIHVLRPSDYDSDSDSDTDSHSNLQLDSDSNSGVDIAMDDEWECYLHAGADGRDNSDALAGEPGLVCVFDIDDTLTCTNSAEAVAACRDLGAKLAVNTAESHDLALNNKAGTGYIDWAALGFPTHGAALDMSFGAFLFGRCSDNCSCSETYGGAPGDCDWCNDCAPGCPASYMGKAYGMHRIAKYYNVEPNKCLVLFDDLSINTDVAQTFCYSAYNHGSCESGWNDEGVYQKVYDYLTSDRFTDCRQ